MILPPAALPGERLEAPRRKPSRRVLRGAIDRGRVAQSREPAADARLNGRSGEEYLMLWARADTAAPPCPHGHFLPAYRRAPSQEKRPNSWRCVEGRAGDPWPQEGKETRFLTPRVKRRHIQPCAVLAVFLASLTTLRGRHPELFPSLPARRPPPPPPPASGRRKQTFNSTSPPRGLSPPPPRPLHTPLGGCPPATTIARPLNALWQVRSSPHTTSSHHAAKADLLHAGDARQLVAPFRKPSMPESLITTTGSMTYDSPSVT